MREVIASSPNPSTTIASGLGICLPFTNFVPSAAESGTVFGTANAQEVIQFVSDQNITLGHLSVFISAPAAASLMGVALYDATGTVKLGAADGFSGAVLGAIRPALNTPVTLQQGIAYWLGWTSNNNTTLGITNFLQSTFFQAIYNAGAIRSGNSNAVTANGITAPNIGVISSAQLRIPLIIFD